MILDDVNTCCVYTTGGRGGGVAAHPPVVDISKNCCVSTLTAFSFF